LPSGWPTRFLRVDGAGKNIDVVEHDLMRALLGRQGTVPSWLSWGVESGAVSLPAETGSIRWPGLSLDDIFLPAEG
jgi:hypothetical protein